MYVTLSDYEQLAFREVTMPPDGSCLFCINSDDSLNVRRRIIDHVLANWEIFKVWTHDVKGDNCTLLFEQKESQFKVIHMPPDGLCYFHIPPWKCTQKKDYWKCTIEKSILKVAYDGGYMLLILRK
jgi:hypothetical protein